MQRKLLSALVPDPHLLQQPLMDQQNNGNPALSNSNLVLAIYVLYFVGYFTGITALIGVIIAHIQVGAADPITRSHYAFQIRTFWIGLGYIILGLLLSVVLVGFAILLWWFVWSLVRGVKGLLVLNEGKAIANPTSWLFG